MANILIGPSPGLLRAQRQQRLGSFQSLYPGLFIDAEHQSVLRRIQVQAHDVQKFGFEIGIRAECEGANPVRLQM